MPGHREGDLIKGSFNRSAVDSGGRSRDVLAEADEAAVDAVIARARDRDLWVIEVENRAGRTLLDEGGLSG